MTRVRSFSTINKKNMIKWSVNMVNEDAEKLIIEIISQIKCIKFYSKWI